MLTLILACAFGQLLVLALWIRRWKWQCCGRIGFLFVAVTFMYHGWPEIVNLVYPDSDPYRVGLSDDAIGTFVLVITLSVIFLTGTYWFIVRRNRSFPTEILIARLNESAFLRWPVLLGIALPSYLFVLLRQTRESDGAYWLTGLTYQFTPFLLVIAFATLNIKTRGRKTLLLFLLFGVFFAVSDSRTTIVINVVIAIAAMIHAGIPLRARKVAGIAGCALALIALVEVSRSVYGRFNEGEQYSKRLEAVASSATTLEEDSGQSKTIADATIADTAYRLDGNAFAAMIAEKQQEGYGIVGTDVLFVPFRLMIPSFLYSDKLMLDEYERTEEQYIAVFYKMSIIDYISGFWASMESFTGIWSLPFWAIVFGWALATLDNWLNRDPGVTAQLVFIGAALAVLGIEQGVASFLFVARGFLVVITLARLSQMRFNPASIRQRRTHGTAMATPQLHAAAKDPS